MFCSLVSGILRIILLVWLDGVRKMESSTGSGGTAGGPIGAKKASSEL